MTKLSHFPLRRLQARLATLVIAFIGSLAAACGGLQLQPKPMAFYDLGIGARSSLPPALAPAQIEIATPPWLEASAMQYRLAWDDPLRRRAYAESRWVSPPPAMLGLALNRALRSEGAGGRCRLRVELDEFIQDFASPDESRVEIVLRAGLLPPRSDKAIAGCEFRAVEAARTANAAGGVEAYRRASARLAGELADWIGALDREPGGGLNATGRCGG